MASWVWLLAAVWAAPFARVVSGDGSPQLELATRDYTHEDGTLVRLVGVAHVAEERFFVAVQGQLADADVVLFEGVGGGPSDGEMPPLNQAYVALASGLDLAFQHDVMDYEHDHWRNSDLTVAELSAASASGGDPIADLLNGGREVRKMARLGAKAERSTLVRVMTRVMLVESLPRAEAQMRVALGEAVYETVVVARNDKVHADLGELRGQRVAVLYGAGHLQELEQRLVADGFTPGEEVWTVAIVGDPESEVPAAVLSMVQKRIRRKLDKLEARAH